MNGSLVRGSPYGVAYDPAWRNRAGVSSTSRTGKVLNDDRADWRAAWDLFLGDVAYVWHGALHATTVAESLKATGFAVRYQIVWAKERLVLGRGDYHWQHEPCWYGVRGKGHWKGDRSQTTLWKIASGNQDTDTAHGTQKPVECMRRPIENNSSPGQAIYEPFCGSGTTVIAAEQTGRSCLALELDPRYCDVIVERWQAFTGHAAILEATGQSFGEVPAAASGPVMTGSTRTIVATSSRQAPGGRSELWNLRSMNRRPRLLHTNAKLAGGYTPLGPGRKWRKSAH